MTQDDLLNNLRLKFGKYQIVGDWVRIPCPTCSNKNRGKMKRYLSLSHLQSKCFICEIPLDFEEVLNVKLADYQRKSKSYPELGKVPHPLSTILPGNKFIPINQLPHSHPAIKFLHKDYLYELDRYYEENGIVYCPYGGGVVIKASTPFVTSSERLIFPVIFNGDLVGWQMRSVPGTLFGDKPTLRYFHLFNKGNYLYNYDNAIKYDSVVLTEGVKKALKFNNGVASLGKGISEKQIQLLQNWKYVSILFDDDADAQKLAQRVVKILNTSVGSKALNINLGLFGYHSPDELDKETLNLVVEESWMKK